MRSITSMVIVILAATTKGTGIPRNVQIHFWTQFQWWVVAIAIELSDADRTLRLAAILGHRQSIAWRNWEIRGTVIVGANSYTLRLPIITMRSSKSVVNLTVVKIITIAELYQLVLLTSSLYPSPGVTLCPVTVVDHCYYLIATVTWLLFSTVLPPGLFSRLVLLFDCYFPSNLLPLVCTLFVCSY